VIEEIKNPAYPSIQNSTSKRLAALLIYKNCFLENRKGSQWAAFSILTVYKLN
jgi:hypothetical protein